VLPGTTLWSPPWSTENWSYSIRYTSRVIGLTDADAAAVRVVNDTNIATSLPAADAGNCREVVRNITVPVHFYAAYVSYFRLIRVDRSAMKVPMLNAYDVFVTN